MFVFMTIPTLLLLFGALGPTPVPLARIDTGHRPLTMGQTVRRIHGPFLQDHRLFLRRKTSRGVGETSRTRSGQTAVAQSAKCLASSVKPIARRAGTNGYAQSPRPALRHLPAHP